LFNLIDRLESLETPGKVPGYKHCAGVLREQLGRRSAGLRSLGSGVYVGPVWTAAGCPFDTVFVVGMTEGRYPTAGISDPLLPDPLKREIDGDGRYLKTVERSIEESRQSFAAVLSSAGQVFMYWPSGVPGESREFGPARWFLGAVRLVSGEPLLQAGQLVHPGPTARGRATQTVRGLTMHRRSDSATLPADQAGDPREYDVLGARSWNLGGNDPTAFPLSRVVPSIADSAKFEIEQGGETWSAYDGKIDVGAIESEPGETPEIIGSATAFETYAACPYRYFLSRRLHVEPTEAPETELALDALSFGTLIHDVLEYFSLWRMGHVGDPPAKSEQEDRLRDAIEDHIEVLKEETPGRSEGAWQIEHTRAWLILRQWLRREPTTAAQPGMRQIEAEYAFGRRGAESAKGGPAVEVRTLSGKTVKFRGQVDRVDISDDGSRVIVYDYKSGGNTAYSKLEDDPIKKGTKLQLPLYSMAVAHKYPEADVSASYWFVRESGNDELKPSPNKYEKDRAESALAAAVETIVEGIDNGVFPARPGDSANWGDGGPSFENCRFCEYERVCPRSKARNWESKKGSDPALANYLNLAEDAE
jgi:RecB family exonuclease